MLVRAAVPSGAWLGKDRSGKARCPEYSYEQATSTKHLRLPIISSKNMSFLRRTPSEILVIALYALLVAFALVADKYTM